ncbi:hypothetical protein NIIDMKKI_51750 [Mycobacterium kansasii]|uniref:Uncharacterized protein n=1 Tax=Mycobacterium kansasii TaxID=1768 RepID=A0A7G1IJI8_MYCKA|nr:hypothetical protein NIIDMKKI_51750 [Mycobacterium kansasii]
MAAPLPFPVHVVERIVVVDHISGNRYGTRFAYHYGYFDVVEREFRGFAKVDQWDSEAFAALDPAGAAPVAANLEASAQVPPAHTVTWFHTGQWERRAEFDAALARDYYGQPQLGEPVVPAGLTVDEEREARRALKGSLLRREVYGLDGTRRQPHPYSVTESVSTVRCLQRRAGNRRAVFHTAPRETITLHYEREPDDPRVQHDLTLEVDDHGNVVRAAQVVYARATPDAELPPEERAAQAAVRVLLAENRMTEPLSEPGTYREPVPCEQRRYELTGIPPRPPRPDTGSTTLPAGPCRPPKSLSRQRQPEPHRRSGWSTTAAPISAATTSAAPRRWAAPGAARCCTSATPSP